ncbi:hypothetical protein PHYBLDRAFT_174686 [Phycomyces blakesleeanus NRRL 1555(-)]|uniref:Uncharacterized protein n=1 Tax=Phycomyces blakesleeanus (strain ATCC 8743b / DSM 1359 / FGSC 10004 / NBRC 33097 / NRRL 1555) TaxID=763407 RepID=A0A167JZL7_PHYB8|nr:hypothetical protein PHYBLDRAFT_174686 [Phycomyces blakesleeanus NRRL 1555(-)]OAD66979.1 hypothetical protein PHYBLDRAFT_174686 [Phycomyces blakesleeanus NRRL 1555(-)]|eukprot:XP_018285019.1 hypothetical protein PHYBLDRAFT_174686 [Phycomyces blakesleeanus NRRL 1555(-)]
MPIRMSITSNSFLRIMTKLKQMFSKFMNSDAEQQEFTKRELRDFEVEEVKFHLKSNDNEEVETPTLTRDLSLSEVDVVFGIEDNEYTGRNNFNNEEYETDGEMSDNEGAYSILKNMSILEFFFECVSKLDFVYRFIIVAITLFVSLYVIDEGVVILILIVNKILELFNDSFHLPLSVSGLKQLAGFGGLTKGIKKYTECGKCHTIYDNNESVSLCCTSPKFDGSSLCFTTLFKAGSKSRIPKKTYIHTAKTDQFRICKVYLSSDSQNR